MRTHTHELKSAIRFLWQYLSPHHFDLIKIIAAVVVTATTILSAGVVLRHYIDHGLLPSQESFLDTSLATLILFSLIISLSAYVRTSNTAWLAEVISSKIKKDLFQHLIHLPQRFFESARLGDLLARFENDTKQIYHFISASAAVTIRSCLQLLGGSILLIISSPQLTLLVFALIPLVVIPILLLGKKVQKLTKEAQTLDSQNAALVEENLSAITTVKAFNNEDFARENLAQITQKKLAVIKIRTRNRSLLIASIIALVFTAISIIVWVGLQQVQAGILSAGQLSAFIFYAILVAGSLNNLTDVLAESLTALSSVQRLIEVFATPVEATSIKHPTTLPLQSCVHIDFQNISFRYPYRDEGAALHQLSFVVEENKKVAIVGPSGAGKSTIFKLLLKFYDPQEGKILINNIPLTKLTLPELRSVFSLVPQDPVMFNASLFDNIRFGHPSASKAEVLAAAEIAYINEFVKQLPQRYDSLIGEKGVRLSGGQKQRVALARAILKNAPIFLLDEATNALDSQSELIVQQALTQTLKNKTTISIAHRLATVQQADLILVLDQGQLIAQGRHTDLLNTCALYKSLAETQLLTA